jgi:limonene-1,2-epoxide hydrolase
MMTSTDTDTLEQQNIDVVTRFCKAWETRDVSQLLELIDDDVYYQMWDADDAMKVQGKAAFEKVIGGFLAGQDTVEFDILRTQCMGKIVINERTDRFVGARGQMVFSITGVFVVEDGKIVHWKDYLFPGKVREMPS